MVKSAPPKVKIEEINLATNRYVRGKDTWSAANLIQWCKEKDYPIFKLPLASVNINSEVWDIPNIDAFIHHMNRCKNVDKSYPILLDDYGQICDGWHRICKAILDGDTEIDAIRIEEMPSNDGKIEE